MLPNPRAETRLRLSCCLTSPSLTAYLTGKAGAQVLCNTKSPAPPSCPCKQNCTQVPLPAMLFPPWGWQLVFDLTCHLLQEAFLSFRSVLARQAVQAGSTAPSPDFPQLSSIRGISVSLCLRSLPAGGWPVVRKRLFSQSTFLQSD